jgi:hypothetical protein
VRDFVAVGYGIPSRPSVVPFAPRRAALVGLAAAAALVAAFALPSLLSKPPVAAGTTFRGGGIHALTPAGTVAGGTEFSWSSDVLPVTYRVEIGDANGVVHGQNTADATLRVPPEVWATLSPGVDYWWTVTALDLTGRVIAASDRQSFRVRPR